MSKQLKEAEEEEDALTRKLLEYRTRVRRLRKQLRIKEVSKIATLEREEASIREAEQLK